MSKALKCDRCGVLYEEYTFYSPDKSEDERGKVFPKTSGVKFVYENNWETCTKDLCPKCAASLYNWWHDSEVSE